ncbi:MAG: hypothetical protein J6038_01105 [Bacilli bacterium]|nr:hypothetical protein [Bacilli bacterium]
MLEKSSRSGIQHGAYIAYSPENPKKVAYQIIATGSEVSLAIEAVKIIEKKLKKEVFEVVSLPSWERFEAQPESFQAQILQVPYESRFSLEVPSTFGWKNWAKTNIGLDEYGKSAPYQNVLKSLGFTAEDVAERILNSLKKKGV